MKLSVALCTYNGARYIREQIESILNQTLRVNEIIVCDDCSTDNTISIIESYHDTTPTDVHIYRNEQNLGVCANFQKAINLCHGDIIFLADQDDIWHRDKTKIIVDYFSSHPDIHVVFSDGCLFYENGSPIENASLWKCFGLKPDGYKYINEGYSIELFSYTNRVTGATLAIHRNFEYLHSFINYCNNGMLHDETIAMLATNNNHIGAIPAELIDYRIHKEQKCGIGDSIIHPYSNNPKMISYTAVQWNRQKLPSPLSDRIAFIATRRRHLIQALGGFRLLKDIRNYRFYYKRQWMSFLLYDLRMWLLHTLHLAS